MDGLFGCFYALGKIVLLRLMARQKSRALQAREVALATFFIV